MEINNANLRSAYVGYNAAFQRGLGRVASQYGQITMVTRSTSRTTEYGWMGKIPEFREWIGDRVVNNLSNHGYALRNKPYELTVGVDRDDFEDDELGIYTPLFEELGQRSAERPDKLVFGAVKASFETVCYDGQYFFDTDHPVLDEKGNEVSVSNTQGGSGTPWFLLDTSRAIKPFVYQLRRPFDRLVRMDKEDDQNVFNKKELQYGSDGRCAVGYGLWQLAYGSKQTLNAANYEAARVAMMEQKGDYGSPLGIVPRTLLVPPSLEGAARKIVKNALAAGGETNEWAGTAEVVVSPWLV